MIFKVRNWGFISKEKMKEVFGFELEGFWEFNNSFPDFISLSKVFDIFLRENDGQYFIFVDKKGGRFRTR